MILSTAPKSIHRANGLNIVVYGERVLFDGGAKIVATAMTRGKVKLYQRRADWAKAGSVNDGDCR